MAEVFLLSAGRGANFRLVAPHATLGGAEAHAEALHGSRRGEVEGEVAVEICARWNPVGDGHGGTDCAGRLPGGQPCSVTISQRRVAG